MKWVKSIIHTFLASALLVATTGVTLHKHYCMGRLKSVAINETSSLCSHVEGATTKMPCCKDVSEKWKVEAFTQTSFVFDSQPDGHPLISLPFFVIDPLPVPYVFTRTTYPPPPLLARDFQANYQVFLL